MSTPHPTPESTRPSVEVQVPRQTNPVEVLHRLGGPVEVTAFDEAGTKIGYIAAIPIDDDEIAVQVVPDITYRLVISRTAEEPEA